MLVDMLWLMSLSRTVGSNRGIAEFPYQIMVKEFYKQWHGKLMLFQCTDCGAERKVEIHNTNKRILHTTKARIQYCRDYTKHANQKFKRMQVVEVHVGPVTRLHEIHRSAIVDQLTVEPELKDNEYSPTHSPVAHLYEQ